MYNTDIGGGGGIAGGTLDKQPYRGSPNGSPVGPTKDCAKKFSRNILVCQKSIVKVLSQLN